MIGCREGGVVGTYIVRIDFLLLLFLLFFHLLVLLVGFLSFSGTIGLMFLRIGLVLALVSFISLFSFFADCSIFVLLVNSCVVAKAFSLVVTMAMFDRVVAGGRERCCSVELEVLLVVGLVGPSCWRSVVWVSLL
jgi:hypothetical protein